MPCFACLRRLTISNPLRERSLALMDQELPRKEWALATTELYWALDQIGTEGLCRMPSHIYTLTRARAIVARAQTEMQQQKR